MNASPSPTLSNAAPLISNLLRSLPISSAAKECLLPTRAPQVCSTAGSILSSINAVSTPRSRGCYQIVARHCCCTVCFVVSRCCRRLERCYLCFRGRETLPGSPVRPQQSRWVMFHRALLFGVAAATVLPTARCKRRTGWPLASGRWGTTTEVGFIT